jgi:peptidyl-dipeptidase A
VHVPLDSAPARAHALSAFVARLVDVLEPLHRAHNEAVWLANVTGAEAHERESARLDAQIRTLFSRPEPYEFLVAVQHAGGVDDALLGRQLTLLVHSHRAHQIPADAIERMVTSEKLLESRFNQFRADLGGRRVTDNALRDVLRMSEEVSERRQAWESSKQIGAEVEAELLGLVRMRNQAARSLGFDHYYGMMLELDELDETALFALLDDLERGTEPLFDSYMDRLDARLAARFRVTPAELRPWHYADPFFQEAPVAGLDLDRYYADRSLEALTATFFAAVGFDVSDLLRRADLYEKPGKCQHAFCLAVDRLDDVRVLCNLRPNEYWMGTMLHEFGHAVYDVAIDRSLPFLLRTPAHTLTTEASAMLFGRLSKNAAWLARYVGVDAEEARRAGDACRLAIREQLLVQTRWELVMCHMERALYRDPEQDLRTLWWDLVERFQRVRRPEGRDAPDWASKIHFSVAPVYYHNYLLGEMMASQLQRHLLNGGGTLDAWDRFVSSPEVGRHLEQTLYRPGRSLDWNGAIARSTGSPLQPAAFVDELAGSV